MAQEEASVLWHKSPGVSAQPPILEFLGPPPASHDVGAPPNLGTGAQTDEPLSWHHNCPDSLLVPTKGLGLLGIDAGDPTRILLEMMGTVSAPESADSVAQSCGIWVAKTKLEA